MLGWMILFALMSLGGATAALTGDPVGASVKMGGLLFFVLVRVEQGSSDRLLRALGQRVRELRTEQGYSQEGFADKCGVHRTFMGAIERGESRLSFSNIAKVAATLGISLSVLFRDLEKHGQEPSAEKARPQPSKRQTTPRPKG